MTYFIYYLRLAKRESMRTSISLSEESIPVVALELIVGLMDFIFAFSPAGTGGFIGRGDSCCVRPVFVLEIYVESFVDVHQV
jgi:hypothetical protein